MEYQEGNKNRGMLLLETKKPTTLKKIVGTNQIEKIEITCLLNTDAKLLVFSDISKLISNF